MSAGLLAGCGGTEAPQLVLTGARPAFVTSDRSAHIEFYTVNAKVQCSIDGADFAACTSDTSADYSNLADGPHIFTVRATNAAGSKAEARYFWTIDSTPPTLDVTLTPLDPTVGGTAAFQFTTSKGNVLCKVDDKPFLPCTSNSSAQITGLTDGSHTLTIKAVDAAGNASPPQAFTWKALCTAPILFVDAAHGDNSNPGTKSKPFKSITKGLSTVTSGQGVQVLPGTYSVATTGETFPLDVPDGACVVGDVANKGAGASLTLVDGGSRGTPPRYVEAATFSPGVGAIVAGFKIFNRDTVGNANTAGVYLLTNDVIVYGNTIIGDNSVTSAYGVIAMGGADKSIVLGNVISGQSQVGLGYFYAGTGGKAELNVITQSAIGLEVDDPTGGPDLGGGPAHSRGGNEFSCNTRNDVWTDFRGPVYLRNNKWDHASPLPVVGADGNGIDVHNEFNHATPLMDGARLVSKPCL